jgi:hypothetical protein
MHVLIVAGTKEDADKYKAKIFDFKF